MKGLSPIEKHAISDMVNKGMTEEDIRVMFPENKQDYVIKQVRENEEAIKQAQKLNYDRPAILAKLAKAGIHGKVADRLIDKALKNVSSKPEVNELYNEIISSLGPRELMVSKSYAGKKIAVMTEEASGKGAGIKAAAPKEYVYKPNGEE